MMVNDTAADVHDPPEPDTVLEGTPLSDAVGEAGGHASRVVGALADLIDIALADNDDGTPEGWLRVTYHLDQLVDVLRTRRRQTAVRASRLMPDKTLEIEGLPLATKRTPKRQVRWDVGLLKSTVERAASDSIEIDRETGELMMGEAFSIFWSVLPCSPSAGWKSGGIEAIGVDPDKYRTFEWGDPTVQFEREGA